jgi:hypothetical protein
MILTLKAPEYGGAAAEPGIRGGETGLNCISPPLFFSGTSFFSDGNSIPYKTIIYPVS